MTKLTRQSFQIKKSYWLLTAHGGSEGLSGKAEILVFSETP